MGNKISGQEYPLSKIFSKEFEYHIPSYQRPYAWTEDETGILFDDLYDFYLSNTDDNYFLGSIVLVKDEAKPYADVIDGQQRLTTVTILLATIANRFSGTQRDTLSKYICEPGNEFESIKPSPRLYLRERDREFFNKIQSLNIDDIITLDATTISSEPQQHIVLNCQALNRRIESTFGTEISKLSDFVQFLLQRCFIIAVSTPNQNSAFRVFSVMNSRGLDLLPIDLIKADVIGHLNEAEREAYTEKWEDLEDGISRADFNELFAHIRMVFAKSKAQSSLLDEYKTFVWPLYPDKKVFVDTILEPFAESYGIIKDNAYKSSGDNSTINNLLSWLSKVDFADWMPVAIKFMASQKSNAEYVKLFFEQLERLVSYLFITSKDVNTRIRRFSLILEEMDKRPGHSVTNPLLETLLSDAEKEELVETLNGDIYRMTAKRRNYILLRLNSFVSDGAVSINPKVFTIEHVLPQTVNPGSQWAQWWPSSAERLLWVHRLGNLVPLTRKINSSAQNYDFEEKKTKYFTTKSGTSSYPLTTQVLGHATWTQSVVVNRQKQLLNIFVSKWDLSTENVTSILDSIIYIEPKTEEHEPEEPEAKTSTLSDSVLVAEICKSGSRWKQVNFSKEIFSSYFGADDEGSGHDIVINNIRPSGEICDDENRKLVSVVSSNYRIELNCEETCKDYPKGPERPIVVFDKKSMYHFTYQVYMPDSDGYDIVLSFLKKIYIGKGEIKRQLTTISALHKDCPIVKV